ncbi:MAG: thioesterase family protein [Chitinophagaceae bacterium]|nr:thioesterase family protein [Chitinophagaceae bacterium]
MARIRIDLPQQFLFSTSIAVRITDLNYGGHVGNDTVLSIIHEARVQFLQSHGYKELNLEGVGLIMSDVAIEFKSELFYGDRVEAYVTTNDFRSVSFDLYYKLQKEVGGRIVLVAIAKTGMVCYNYQQKKIVAVPAGVKLKLGAS